MTKEEKLEKRVYTYVNESGKTQEVYTDYYGWLFLRLCYGKDGLTEEEYIEYKNQSN